MGGAATACRLFQLRSLPNASTVSISTGIELFDSCPASETFRAPLKMSCSLVDLIGCHFAYHPPYLVTPTFAKGRKCRIFNAAQAIQLPSRRLISSPPRQRLSRTRARYKYPVDLLKMKVWDADESVAILSCAKLILLAEIRDFSSLNQTEMLMATSNAPLRSVCLPRTSRVRGFLWKPGELHRRGHYMEEILHPILLLCSSTELRFSPLASQSACRFRRQMPPRRSAQKRG